MSEPKLEFFVYTEGVWSQGDSLTLDRTFSDEDAMRDALRPWGLDQLADVKSAREYEELSVLGSCAMARVEATVVELRFPADAWEWLNARDHSAAAFIDASIRERGLQRFVTSRGELDDIGESAFEEWRKTLPRATKRGQPRVDLSCACVLSPLQFDEIRVSSSSPVARRTVGGRPRATSTSRPRRQSSTSRREARSR